MHNSRQTPEWSGCVCSMEVVMMRLFTWIPEGVRRAFGQIWWVFPLLLLALGFLVPVLHRKVFALVPYDEMVVLLVAIVVEILLAGAWLLSEFFAVSDQLTSVRRLRVNNAVSTSIGLVLSVVGGGLIADGTLMWGFVVPWAAALIDTYVSGDRGINNAAQKPLVHEQKVRP